MTELKRLERKAGKAFGKEIVLLGQFKGGEFVWLEVPKWDCEWYWAFGYLETYTNNKNPHLSRDINSHQHVDGVIFKPAAGSGRYIHHFNDSPDFEATVLDEKESWVLADLFKQYYTLKSYAEILHQGHSNISGDPAAQALYMENIVTGKQIGRAHV